MTARAAHHRPGRAGRRGAAGDERAASPITTLFVVDRRDIPVGILHVHDLLRAGVA